MEQAEQLRLEGVIESIIFHSEETGFTVMEVAVDDELVTVVGESMELSPGEEIAATGAFTAHPSYGRQFKASCFERVMPATATAMLRYLSGGAVRGIGPALAQKIVAKFGDRSLEVLENDPARLAQIRGISPKKAVELGEAFRRILGVRAVMEFLAARGIGAATAIAVWKKWGGLSQQTVSADPYCLCEREIGVPFEQADEIAAGLGVEADAPCRIRGGVLYVLTHNLGNGHACLPADKLLDTACRLLQVPLEAGRRSLLELTENGAAVIDQLGGREYVYLPEQYSAECYAADRLALMMRFPAQEQPVSAEELSILEEELSISYADRQRRAIAAAVSEPMMILTGGPGTGKTTTLNGIITLFERRAMKVALAAPTGRAAKRLSEVTGREAKTIHRLLEVDFGSEAGVPRFKRSEKNPLPFDAVVVDEMSMVDAVLFQSLLKAVRTDGRLVLVGDPDQLPSVGAGNVLRDLIDSGAVACIHLDEVFRQAANSLIVTSAHRIVSGQMPELSRRDADFFFLPAPSFEQAASTVTDLCARRLPKAYGYSPIRDIQVIAPTKQGAAGTNELNGRLQEALNPALPGRGEHRFGQLLLREGDKVMQTRNNYDLEWERDDGEEGLGIFNGDIGFIEMIDRASRSVMVRFDDRRTVYSFDQIHELDLAYAVTVHKSQGNEFDAVVMPLVGRHRRLHYRNLLYTAVTRAKRLLILVGEARTVAAMVENDRKTLRYTNLAARLRAAREETG